MKKVLFVLIIFHFQTYLKAQSVLSQITDSLDNRYATVIHYFNDSSQHIIEHIMYDSKAHSKKKSKTKIKWIDSIRFLVYDTICDKTIFLRSEENLKINLPIAHRYPGNNSVKDSSIIEYSIQTQNGCTNIRGLKKYSLSPISVYQVEFSPILNDCLIVELFRGSGECCHSMRYGVGYFLLFVFEENSSSIKKVFYGSGIIYN